jgi:DNA repair protein RecO (recombination protein O)
VATQIPEQGSKQQIESPAIVLDCRDHGESDKIITFFCQKLGRITGIAKGAKRSKKRFVNKLEIFSSLLIQHTIPQNGRLAFIAEASLLDGFLSLRTDFTRYTTANVVREIVLLATKDLEGDDELYPLLHWVLQNVNSCKNPNPILIFFLIRFFAIIGYSPNLTSCTDCGCHLVQHEIFSFHVQSGGILCDRCNKEKHTTRIRLSCGTLRSLDMALKQPLDRLQRLQLTEQSQREALSFFHLYARQLFQREIVSWQFLV